MKQILLFSLLFFTTALMAKTNEKDWVNLFNGKDLTGWKQLNGEAKYEVVNGEIVGTTVANTPNSFLSTEKNYGDFILELELLVDNDMNSGIQFRSLSSPDYQNGRVHGYQCEVDPSARAWSGGIYDEARRGWLYPGTLNPEGGKAFKKGEWNKYRIECVGNNIRTWINGVPVAHLIDDMTAEGFISLQVHSIGRAEQAGNQIRWRNIRIKTTGLKPTLAPDVFVVNLLANNLSETEKAQGYKLLFDGKTSAGWKSVHADGFPEQGWEIKDGLLSVLGKKSESEKRPGDIVTVEKFKAFDLQFEFMLTEGANSGVKYGLGNNGPSIGLEYQILDDERHPDASMGAAGNRKMASLYDLIPAEKQSRFVNPVGSWNRGRVVVYPDNRVEHWLNGIKLVEYVRDSNIYRALVARSKYAGFEAFGLSAETPVLLQDHNDTVHFRSIKIKPLN
ncbi:3-keto-disaccharide hydrolase [Gaoshiqia sp. Z1-71]|uniref:3-keto-disaccharide hydrolase n=1 Tax=Gaoshiqia hydrogeniformans TaxID=3290090 RepID=UPI003BF9006D